MEEKMMASRMKAVVAVDDAEMKMETVFEWRQVDATAERPNEPADPLALCPLTPGKYHFRGFMPYQTAQPPPPSPPPP